ncbi:hypothetical protein EV385_4558 [Krasilnikovia cinnamomea]|uniref:Uncharacterized protein n=1 Tax=Krasilnikovia cinnamomea TaxID=349313 RepID=A0A4Q7ZQM3_9ACTN|nr:hypothetical protein [Krasilnikovia cinnamomea]RZU52679.1 hypothetical protein EV385_4558 [Krasilnikovia cinnamomea]
MPIEVLMDRQVRVEYSQLYVVSDPDDDRPDLQETYRGQTNGLCGAADLGNMTLTTGIEMGPVSLRAELHGSEPPVEDSWEDVVEVSFTATTDQVMVQEWDGDTYPLNLPSGQYRVRYCVRGMDQAHRVGISDEPVDFYLLQFWPGPPAADRIIRQTSKEAAHAHDVVQRRNASASGSRSRRSATRKVNEVRRMPGTP